jgi:hypothetical protein
VNELNIKSWQGFHVKLTRMPQGLPLHSLFLHLPLGAKLKPNALSYL